MSFRPSVSLLPVLVLALGGCRPAQPAAPDVRPTVPPTVGGPEVVPVVTQTATGGTPGGPSPWMSVGFMANLDVVNLCDVQGLDGADGLRFTISPPSAGGPAPLYTSVTSIQSDFWGPVAAGNQFGSEYALQFGQVSSPSPHLESTTASVGLTDGADGWRIEWPLSQGSRLTHGQTSHAGYEFDTNPAHKVAVEYLFEDSVTPFAVSPREGCREQFSLDWGSTLASVTTPVALGATATPGGLGLVVPGRITQHSRATAHADVSYMTTALDLTLSDLTPTSTVITNTIALAADEPMPMDQPYEFEIPAQESDKWVVVVARWKAAAGDGTGYVTSFHAVPIAILPGEPATPAP